MLQTFQEPESLMYECLSYKKLRCIFLADNRFLLVIRLYERVMVSLVILR